MIEYLHFGDNKITVSEFYENHRNNKYNYNASYQRDKVWSPEKKSFLMDSILKNYPIPPVFLRLKIDRMTGASTYDVIDGKQRLTTIADYLDGNVCLPDDFVNDESEDAVLNGADFKVLSNLERFVKLRQRLWRYSIPVIYLDTDDNTEIQNIFDRLNRNGEPLTPQELRNATYSQSDLYVKIKEILTINVWKEIFDSTLEVSRKEDEEFISELVFLTIENRIQEYNKNTLDNLYDKWKIKFSDSEYNKVLNVNNYIKNLTIDYCGYKIAKVSHLYAIWGISFLALEQGVPSKKLSEGLNAFYSSYLTKQNIEGYNTYKRSMSSSTKSRSSRLKRIEALAEFLKVKDINIQVNL